MARVVKLVDTRDLKSRRYAPARPVPDGAVMGYRLRRSRTVHLGRSSAQQRRTNLPVTAERQT